MPIAPKPDIPGKFCEACGKPLVRKRYRGVLESNLRYRRREHCDQSCANSRQVVGKSAQHWRARRHRKRACEECGASPASDLHVHHADGNVANNDPQNLHTLCGSCHLRLHWRDDREKRLATNPWAPRRAAPDAGELPGDPGQLRRLVALRDGRGEEGEAIMTPDIGALLDLLEQADLATADASGTHSGRGVVTTDQVRQALLGHTTTESEEKP